MCCKVVGIGAGLAAREWICGCFTGFLAAGMVIATFLHRERQGKAAPDHEGSNAYRRQTCSGERVAQPATTHGSVLLRNTNMPSKRALASSPASIANARSPRTCACADSQGWAALPITVFSAPPRVLQMRRGSPGDQGDPSRPAPQPTTKSRRSQRRLWLPPCLSLGGCRTEASLSPRCPCGEAPQCRRPLAAEVRHASPGRHADRGMISAATIVGRRSAGLSRSLVHANAPTRLGPLSRSRTRIRLCRC